MVKALDIKFLRQRKRSVLCTNLDGIKQNFKRKGDIQSVLEFSIRSSKGQIVNDLQ